MTNFSKSHIEGLKRSGKIRDYNFHQSHGNQRKNILAGAKPSPQKQWIEDNLQWWCNEKGLTMTDELKFSKERNFRFDYAVESIKLAIEYEGIFSSKSRHTTVSGYSRDTEKYNLAQLEGWIVLRYSASTYQHLTNDLKKVRI